MKSSRIEVLGGVALAAIAAFALIATSHLDAGTAAEIGPGAPPRVFALILLGLGLLQVAVSLFKARHAGETLISGFATRQVVTVLGAVVAFGLLVQPLGILGAAPILLMLAGLASTETKWLGYVVYVIGLVIFCAVLFRVVLGLPMPLAPWALGY
jgi:putative tricarboxylic transport membrane protein